MFATSQLKVFSDTNWLELCNGTPLYSRVPFLQARVEYIVQTLLNIDDFSW